jgi:hypothetical protein
MRKKQIVTIGDWGGRDTGKVFVVHEQNVLTVERWTGQAIAVLKGTKGEITPEMARFGYAGAALGFLNACLAADVDMAKAQPVLDEMRVAIEIVRDPKNHPEVTSPVRWELDDVEELKTLEWLRSEVVNVNLGFSPAELLSRAASAIRAMQELMEKEPSSTAPMSPPPSPAPSQAASSASLN